MFPSQIETLEQARGKSRSQFSDLKAVGAKPNPTFIPMYMGQAAQEPPPRPKNPGFYAERTQKYGMMPSDIVEASRQRELKQQAVDVQVMSKAQPQQFYPSLILPK